MRRATVRVLGWLTLLVGMISALRMSATGDLSAPPVTSIGGLGDWTEAREPATAAIALVRFAAELGAWYLLALTVLYGLASALRSRGIASLADALAAPGASRLVRTGLGLGLLASTAVGASSSSGDATANAPSTARMQPVDAPDDQGTAWMVPVTGEQDRSVVLPTETERAATTWTVSEGESFWTIAADLIERSTGRPPTDAEIVPFWQSLIDANRDRLVDRDDPDLIHPGQVFEIPVR